MSKKPLSIYNKYKPKNWMWLPINKKKCNKCKEVKFVSEFYPRKGKGNGFAPWCKECQTGRMVEPRSRKPKSKQLSIYMCAKPKNWMWLPIQEKKCTKCGEIKHLTEFHKKNTGRNVGGRRYQCIACVRKYDQKRNESIPAKLYYGCVSRINSMLWRYGLLLPEYNNKFDLVGCTVEELMDHLQKQFLPGMSWDTYGRYNGWCMDHIKPIAMFDLTDRSQIEECFHYTNVQPLWFRDNSRKSSFYNGVRHYYQ